MGYTSECSETLVLSSERRDVRQVSGMRVSRKRELFIDNLLVRTYLIIEVILVDQPCAMGVRFPFSR